MRGGYFLCWGGGEQGLEVNQLGDESECSPVSEVYCGKLRVDYLHTGMTKLSLGTGVEGVEVAEGAIGSLRVLFRLD